MAFKVKPRPGPRLPASVRPRPTPTARAAMRPRPVTQPIRRPASASLKTALQANPLYFGATQPDILFIVDPMVGHRDDDEAPKATKPLNKKQLEFLTHYCRKHGIPVEKSAILSCCPPVTAEVWDNAKKMGLALKGEEGKTREAFANVIKATRPKVIVPLGKSAASQLANRSVQITKVRGIPTANEEFCTIQIPGLGIGHVIRIPENESTFDADMETVGKVVKAGFNLQYQTKIKQDYRWITNLQPLLDELESKGRLDIALDTEYTGGEWYDASQRLLTVQISAEAGVAYAIPYDYCHKEIGWHAGKRGDPIVMARVKKQLKKLLEDKRVHVCGQNFKGDYHVLRERLGIEVANYDDDTILLAHNVDENIKNKALSELTRLYVKELAGYSDEFDKDPIHEDKSRMDKVPPKKMLFYGCGDTDATIRCKDRLTTLAKEDPVNYRCYQKVVMPAQRALCNNEVEGFHISVENLRKFEKMLRAHQQAEYRALVNMIPQEIRFEYMDKPGKPSLTRPELLRAMLFHHPKGLKLKPRIFTKGTRNLRGGDELKIPSTSSKDHLPYFEHIPFVARLIDYIKNDKLLVTYVGTENGPDGKPTGFYKYIRNGRIRPSYLLHRTVTGRSASVNPNGQNFPKRGKFAKAYREIFVAPPGHVLIQVDYSQMELRIAAMMANDPYMLRLYREGVDIHAATAATVMGISIDAFNRLPTAERDLARFRAKAVNFGFLYGMGWRKFIIYAKTEYKIDYTDEEAQRIREAFFNAYRNLQSWHRKIREYVRAHGYVRAYDGRTRHLTSVFSPDEAIASGAERQAINSPVQAFGSDLGLMALALIDANVSKKLVRVIGFIHDAIVCIAREDQAVEAAQAVQYWMEHVPLKKLFNFEPNIPLIAEAEVGKNLSKMIEIKQFWLAEGTVKDYGHLQYMDWQARCKKARELNEPQPPEVGTRPGRSGTARRRILARPSHNPAPFRVKPRPRKIRSA